MPVPAKVGDSELHAAFCACCQHVCVAEKSGLTMEDVYSIEELIKFIINGVDHPQRLHELTNQIANTLGFLETEQPQGWEEDYGVLNDFLIVISEAGWALG